MTNTTKTTVTDMFANVSDEVHATADTIIKKATQVVKKAASNAAESITEQAMPQYKDNYNWITAKFYDYIYNISVVNF